MKSIQSLFLALPGHIFTPLPLQLVHFRALVDSLEVSIQRLSWVGEANWTCRKFGGVHPALTKKHESQDSEVVHRRGTSQDCQNMVQEWSVVMRILSACENTQENKTRMS